MKLQASLSQRSMNQLIGDLKQYESSLQDKTGRLVSRLLTEGIRVAEFRVGAMGKYILFQKDVEDRTDKIVGLLIGENRNVIESVWKTKEGLKKAKVSPILMAEFGSGWLAEVLFDDAVGVGQGTFPGQTHAFDEKGWNWMDTEGHWHHSKGFKPTHPMYIAEMRMLSEIYEIAREVFADD